MLLSQTKYRLNAMDCTMWLAEYLANKNITGWLTYENASRGLGFKAEWFKRTMHTESGKDFLLRFFTTKEGNVAAGDVWKVATDIPIRDFKSYAKMNAKLFERLVRESKIVVYHSEFRRRKCITLDDALSLLFWLKVKALTSNYFPYEKAMQLRSLSSDLLREYIMRYNLKQGW